MSDPLVLSLLFNADNKQLVSKSRESSAEVKRFAASANDAGRKTDELGAAVRDTSGRLRDAKGRFIATGKGVQDFDSNVTSASASLGVFTGLLATLGIGTAASEMYQGIDAMQGYRAQLKTITGDIPAATAELRRLIEFAKTTPYTLEQSVEGFAKLTNLGLVPSERALRSYGNTAAAMNKDLMQMVEAVADASVGEFERLKEFGIKASQSANTVSFTFKGTTTTIKKDAQSIQEYLLNIGETDFAGAMTDQMSRLSAKSSNLGMSFTQLWDTAGNMGAADAIGGAIDGMATGVDALAANLPEVVALLETMGIIVGTGTALYLAPLIFTKMKARALGAATAIGALNTQLSMTQKSLALIGAAVTGYQIGDYLQEQFLTARLAGLAFVSGMLKGWEALKYGFEVATTSISHVWDSMLNGMRERYATLLGFIGTAADKIGADELAAKIQAWESATRDNITSQDDLQTKLASLSSEYENAKDQIDEVMFGLWQSAEAEFAAAEATEQKTTATQEQTDVLTQNKAATDAIVDVNEEYIKQLTQELALGKVSKKERAVLLNLKKLDADATEAQKKQVRELTEALYEQQNASKSVSTDKLVEQANDFGKAWSNAGNAITEAFGSVADQINALTDSETRYFELTTALADKKIEVEKDANLTAGERERQLADLTDAEINLADQRLQANMGSYAGMARAAGQFFDEQSSAREKLHKIETAFAIIETALALKKAAANALNAIATQGQGDPYTAFGRIAAMAALMAGLGLFSGSVSGSAPPSSAVRQETQGTGTVLGDASAKSESILNTFERIEDLELDQYAELRDINRSIKDLNSAIISMATRLAGSYGRFDENTFGGDLGSVSHLDTGGLFEKLGSSLGGFLGDPLGELLDGIIGSFSKTKKSLEDSGIKFISQSMQTILETGMLKAVAYFDIKTKKSSWWGLSSKTSYDTEYEDIDASLQREFALIFTSIGDSLTGALDVLGIEATQSLESFVLSMSNISLKDLSGEELQAELEAVFSAQADKMAQWITSSVSTAIENSGPQWGGEGPFLHESDGYEVTRQAMGDSWLTDFQKMGEGLYDTLMRLAQEQAVFNSVLEMTGQALGELVGVDMIGATQSIIELAGGIEALNDAANTFFNEFLSDDQQFDFIADKVAAQFESLDLALPDSRDGFVELLESLDLTTESGQQMYSALMALLPLLDQYYDALEDQADAADKAAEKEKKLAEARTGFNDDLTKELERMDMTALEKSLDDIRTWYDAAKAEAEELGADTALLDKLFDKKAQALAEQSIQDAMAQADAELASIKSQYEESVAHERELYAQRVASVRDFSSALRESMAELNVALGNMTQLDFLKSKEQDARTALNQAQGVDEQLAALEQLHGAIMARYSEESAANTQMLNDALARRDKVQASLDAIPEKLASDISALKREFEQLSTSAQRVSSGLSKSILSIETTKPDFDPVAFYTRQATQAYADLTSEVTQDELDRITRVKSAVLERYNAERAVIDEQIKALEQSQSALQTNLRDINSEFESATASVRSEFESLISSIERVASSTRSTMAAIRADMPGYNPVEALNTDIERLYTQLSNTDDVQSQLVLLDDLQAAISQRYDAELAAVNDTADAAQSRYELELDSYQQLKDASEQLADAAEALRVGPLSALTSKEQYVAAQDQFERLVERARAGDADAMAQIDSAGSKFLELAQQYEPGDYSSAFNNVLSVYDELAALELSEPTAPPPHAITEQLDAKKVALANSTLNELSALATLTDSLAQDATESMHYELRVLRAQFSQDSRRIERELTQAAQAITDLQAEQLILADSTTDELKSLQSLASAISAQSQAELSRQTDALRQSYASEAAQLESALSAANDEVTALQATQTQLQSQTLAQLQELAAQASQLESESLRQQNEAIESLKEQYASEQAAVRETLEEEIATIRTLLPEHTQAFLDSMEQELDVLIGIKAAIENTPPPQSDPSTRPDVVGRPVDWGVVLPIPGGELIPKPPVYETPPIVVQPTPELRAVKDELVSLNRTNQQMERRMQNQERMHKAELQAMREQNMELAKIVRSSQSTEREVKRANSAHKRQAQA
ncbi:hypothetical protein EXT46_05285 [Pseudoalteromonas sp. CO325X]|uniref:hypothetical protein n=1 Tax=Pseudoalteromonas sp. CO325X TaxID=1777262 RepID=UPI001022F5BC|nr:hypothetical protein [Pseudoalteromonas sp. CO325X]RZF83707.1 hypothetical protein EXT46_05285 [Pseudoalteromonas sp. CO325X]